jgi:NitT/TauT family transport system ATP-binding protein
LDHADFGDPEIGLSFQEPALLPWKTCLQNVILPAEIRGMDTQEARDRARRLLAWFGLAALEDRKPHELPPGADRAVSVCRSMILRPKISFFDDPFRELDSLVLEQMIDCFQRMWEEFGSTGILATGDIPQAVMLSDRIAVMSSAPGRILEFIRVEIPHPRRMNRATGIQVAEYCHKIRMMFRSHAVIP